jgi:hypothetical protein
MGSGVWKVTQAQHDRQTAGNGPLSAVLATRRGVGPYQYEVRSSGHAFETGFEK